MEHIAALTAKYVSEVTAPTPSLSPEGFNDEQRAIRQPQAPRVEAAEIADSEPSELEKANIRAEAAEERANATMAELERQMSKLATAQATIAALQMEKAERQQPVNGVAAPTPQRKPEFAIVNNCKPKELVERLTTGWQIHFQQFTPTISDLGYSKEADFNVVFVREVPVQPAPQRKAAELTPAEIDELAKRDIPLYQPPPPSAVGTVIGLDDAPAPAPRPETFAEALNSGRHTADELKAIGDAAAFEAGCKTFQQRTRPVTPSFLLVHQVKS